MQDCHGVVPVDRVTWLHDRPLEISKAKAALSEGGKFRVAGQQCEFNSLKRLPTPVGIDRLGPPYPLFSYLDLHIHQINRMVLGMLQWKVLDKVVCSTSNKHTVVTASMGE